MPKTAHELTRKEMKGPDHFQVAASQVAAWVGKRQKHLAFGAVGLVVLALLGIGVSFIVDSGHAKAAEGLYKAVEAASGEVSSIPLPNLEAPVYKTKEEKEQAVIAAANRVRTGFAKTSAAATATLLEGDAELALGHFDQAIAAYQSFLAEVPATDSLRFGGLDGLARAQEGKGDLDGAAATYRKAAEIAAFKDLAQIELGRILALAGKKDEARKALEAVPKDSAFQATAQERLARLGAK
jgi:tetratricopeptide (TPR) repeat protein